MLIIRLSIKNVYFLNRKEQEIQLSWKDRAKLHCIIHICDIDKRERLYI